MNKTIENKEEKESKTIRMPITLVKEIEKLAKEKYGNLEGLAQQYLFYWKRDTA